MREAFHARLDALADHTAAMCESAGALLEHATSSVCDTDRARAEFVIAKTPDMDRQCGRAEDMVVELLALQAPVASDLRRVVSELWIVGDVDRMRVLATHVAQATLRRYPEAVLPADISPVFARMGKIGVELAGQAAAALRARDVALAEAVTAKDPEVARLYRELLTTAVNPSWPHGVAAAIDTCLLGRFYDRFADHAVLIADRVVYQVTGHRSVADTD